MTANRATRRAVRAVAKRPPARTIDVELNGGGAFDGWWLRARADFPAALLAELQSGDIARVMAVLDVVIVDHNMPDEQGELAGELGQVQYDGLLRMAGALFDELGRLPPR